MSETTGARLNGPILSIGELDDLVAALSTWGTFPDLSRGAAARITPEVCLRALSAARSGRVVPMALPWNTTPGVDNPRPAAHQMTDLGNVEAPEPSTYKDYLGVDYHGKSVSHLDALAHIAYRGRLYGDVAADEAVTTHGTTHGSVAALGPLVLRGVLLDMPVVKGVDWLEPGQAVHASDILEAEDRLGVHIEGADAVLLRSGHFARRRVLGAWDSGAASAGWHPRAMAALAEREIALLGADGDSDVRPSPVPGVHSPIHILAITVMGVPLLDNLDLEALSTACAEEGRYAFTLVVAPLNVPHGTGSPVNPVAVL